MTPVSAHDVAAELRVRLPGVGTKKLHKLLYYCQGHHLATFDQPLFTESVSAWDMGPVVGTLWRAEREGEGDRETQALSEAQLNTVGYVVSRYGALTGGDLERLTHAEEPWQEADRARTPGTSVRISAGSMRAHFLRSGEDEGDGDIALPDVEVVRDWLKGAPDRLRERPVPDDLERLRARLAAGG